MTTILAIIGVLALAYLCIRFLPAIIGGLMPKISGREYLKKQLYEVYGYPKEMFSNSFIGECVDADYRFAEKLNQFGMKDKPKVSYFLEGLENSAHLISSILQGKDDEGDGFIKMKERMSLYGITPDFLEVKTMEGAVSFFQKLFETDSDTAALVYGEAFALEYLVIDKLVLNEAGKENEVQTYANMLVPLIDAATNNDNLMRAAALKLVLLKKICALKNINGWNELEGVLWLTRRGLKTRELFISALKETGISLNASGEQIKQMMSSLEQV